jgi:hypothetical protein
MSYLVRQAGGYALKFHTNACGRQATAVADAEATEFPSHEEAFTRATQTYGLHPQAIAIEPISKQTKEEGVTV